MISIETLIEAQIVQISLDKEGAHAEFEIRSADRRMHWHLIANGIDEFLIQDMRLNNIIDDILVYDYHDAENEDFSAYLYDLLAGKEISPSDASSTFLQARIKSFISGENKLWVIRPIYGALIVILAKEIFIRENDRV